MSNTLTLSARLSAYVFALPLFLAVAPQRCRYCLGGGAVCPFLISGGKGKAHFLILQIVLKK